MLLASHAILRVSSAVKRYSQIKTVSFFSANTRLGTGNQFFFFFFFHYSSHSSTKIRVDKQKWSCYAGTLGEGMMRDEDLEEK